MTEYTPTDDDLARAWKSYRDAADAASAWVREDDAEPAEKEARRALARVRRDAWQAGHTTGFEDALLACEIASGVKPGPPPGPTPNPHEETR